MPRFTRARIPVAPSSSERVVAKPTSVRITPGEIRKSVDTTTLGRNSAPGSSIGIRSAAVRETFPPIGSVLRSNFASVAAG